MHSPDDPDRPRRNPRATDRKWMRIGVVVYVCLALLGIAAVSSIREQSPGRPNAVLPVDR